MITKMMQKQEWKEKKDCDRHRNGLGTATEMMEGAAVLDPLKRRVKRIQAACQKKFPLMLVNVTDS